MGEGLTNIRILGVALMLFSAILLGVGIHHVVATGTCSSTGYSAHYGPVPHCPSGTGAWFAFVFGGIIGSLAGGMMSGGMGLIFAGIFGGIGFGALSLVLDNHVSGSTQTFAAAFGGSFAVVGTIAGIATLGGALSALRSETGRRRSSGPGRSGSKTRVSGSRVSGGPRGPGGARPVVTPSSVPFSTPVSASVSMGVPATNPGAVDSLAKLGQLHQQGVLTDAEFVAAKSKLLGSV